MNWTRLDPAEATSPLLMPPCDACAVLPWELEEGSGSFLGFERGCSFDTTWLEQCGFIINTTTIRVTISRRGIPGNFPKLHAHIAFLTFVIALTTGEVV